ncbi:MAG: GNAT family N-acetyltransferase [Clostridia bacterium]
MNIRKAANVDLDAIMTIYHSAQTFMAQHGNPSQWGTAYPMRELVEEDIAQGRSWVCAGNGRVLAVFVLQMGEEPTYAQIRGGWKNNRPYATLHRVASSGERRGMTDAIVAWASARAGELRADTHEKNLSMQRALERSGFERCGLIRVTDGTERIAYQRAAEENVPCVSSSDQKEEFHR